jgi:voltage-gated potassium channel
VTPASATTEIWRPLERKAVRRILYGFVAIGLVSLYGTIGYIAMGWSLLDAVYQVVITVSGVGFGEVRPVTSTLGRVHTMLVIALGVLSVAFTLAAFVQFLTETEILGYFGRQRTMHQIDSLTGHTIVAGYGRMGALVCDELAARQLPFVVVEMSRDEAAQAEAHGFLCIVGDATDEKVLRQSGIARAKVLVCAMPNDADNVFITLTARQVCPSMMIIARAEQANTPKKLRQAGANHIVMPAAIGAHRIVSLLTNPAAVEFAELVTKGTSVAIEMDELPIKPASILDGSSLREADIKRRTGVIVVAVKRGDGRLEFPAASDETLFAGDSLVVLGRREHLDQFRRDNLGEESAA